MNTIGHRHTERSLQLGELYSPQQALSIGLVDKIVPQESVLKSVEEEMARWLKIPGKRTVLVYFLNTKTCQYNIL